MEKESEKNDKLETDFNDKEIKSIDPTKLGGLDGSSVPNLDDEALNWTKSRGKKKD